MKFTEIDETFEGTVPEGADLVVVERSNVTDKSFNSAMILYGFDEMGIFTNEMFVSPVYGFLYREGN